MIAASASCVMFGLRCIDRWQGKNGRSANLAWRHIEGHFENLSAAFQDQGRRFRKEVLP